MGREKHGAWERIRQKDSPLTLVQPKELLQHTALSPTVDEQPRAARGWSSCHVFVSSCQRGLLTYVRSYDT